MGYAKSCIITEHCIETWHYPLWSITVAFSTLRHPDSWNFSRFNKNRAVWKFLGLEVANQSAKKSQRPYCTFCRSMDVFSNKITIVVCLEQRFSTFYTSRRTKFNYSLQTRDIPYKQENVITTFFEWITKKKVFSISIGSWSLPRVLRLNN